MPNAYEWLEASTAKERIGLDILIRVVDNEGTPEAQAFHDIHELKHDRDRARNMLTMNQIYFGDQMRPNVENAEDIKILDEHKFSELPCVEILKPKVVEWLDVW